MSPEELAKRVEELEERVEEEEERGDWLEEALHALAKKAGFAIAPRVGEDDEEDE